MIEITIRLSDYANSIKVIKDIRTMDGFTDKEMQLALIIMKSVRDLLNSAEQIISEHELEMLKEGRKENERSKYGDSPDGNDT